MTTPVQPVNEDGRTCKILIVDDSIGARILARTILSAAGHACAEARNGAEAFDMILREAFDIVVTDLEMPQMDGFELIRALGFLPQGFVRPWVIVASARLDDPRVNIRPELRSAAALIEKPVTPELLLEAVHGIMNPDVVETVRAGQRS